jgi:hypothetical protein
MKSMIPILVTGDFNLSGSGCWILCGCGDRLHSHVSQCAPAAGLYREVAAQLAGAMLPARCIIGSARKHVPTASNTNAPLIYTASYRGPVNLSKSS